MRYKGLIFDMDGTLTVPIIDFITIRRKLGIMTGDIVPIIGSWPEPRRRAAWKIIEDYERRVLAETRLQPGAAAALQKFQQHQLKLAILTRNSTHGAETVLKNLPVTFHPVLTRDYPYIKPAPEPVWDILDCWQLQPHEVMVIGDYIHDIECGRNAGTATCFFANPDAQSYADAADFAVTSFKELEQLVLTQ